MLLAGSVMPGVAAGYDDLNLGIAARNSGAWDSAIASFDKALAAGDLVPDQEYIAHLDRGEAYTAKDQHSEAIADFLAAVGLRQDDQPAQILLANEYFVSNNPDDALHALDSVIAHDSDGSAAHLLRAEVYEILGDHQKQLDDLQLNLAKNPDVNADYIGLGIAEFQLGQPDLASAAFAKANQKSLYVWIWSALSNLKGGKVVPSDTPPATLKGIWPATIVTFFQGHGSEGAVFFASEAQTNETARRGQVCEANFYLGEWRIFHGDRTGAKILFQKAAEDCPRNFIEWPAALAELKNAP